MHCAPGSSTCTQSLVRDNSHVTKPEPDLDTYKIPMPAWRLLYHKINLHHLFVLSTLVDIFLVYSLSPKSSKVSHQNSVVDEDSRVDGGPVEKLKPVCTAT